MGEASLTNHVNNKNYSPIYEITTTTYNINKSNVGTTISPVYALNNSSITINLTQTISTTLPKGAEIAILNNFNTTITIASNGIRVAIPGNIGLGDGYGSTATHSYRTIEPNTIIALKKTNNDTNGDCWILIGNVEVVS